MAQRKYNYRDCLIAESPQITVKRVLGNTKADILQKILYWTNHTKESKITLASDKFGIERRWIYHSAKQFENELQLDWTTIRDHLQDMEKDFVRYTGTQYPDNEPIPYLFSAQFLKPRGYNVKFYSVDKVVLWDYISRWLPMQKTSWEDSLQSLEEELQKIEVRAKKEQWPKEAIDYEASELRQKIKYWKPLINRCKRVPTEEKIEEINTNLAMYYQQYFPQPGQEVQDYKNDNEEETQKNETPSDPQESQDEKVYSSIELLNKLQEELPELDDFTEEEKEVIKKAEGKINNTKSNQEDGPL